MFFAEKSAVASPQSFISQELAADLVLQASTVAVRVLVVAEREPPVAGLVLHREGRAPKLQASTQYR